MSRPGRCQQEGEGDTTIVLIDCGAKRNIARSLLARNVRVITVPWDWNPFTDAVGMDFDGIVVSNGPGNPKDGAENYCDYSERNGA